MKKKIILSILVVMFTISVGFNLWSLGRKAWKTHARNIRIQAANEAIWTVAALAVKNREVTIKTPSGNIILVLKEVNREPEKAATIPDTNTPPG